MNEKEDSSESSSGVSEGLAYIAAGVLAGSAAAIATHPFDTVKTRVQGDLSMRNSMCRELLQKGVFVGLGWRVAVIATAITGLPLITAGLQRLWNATK